MAGRVASVEAAFVLLDRASPSLRNMRREAQLTEAAFDRLGNTMDKSGRSKASGPAAALKGLSTSAKQADQDVSRVNSQLGGLQRSSRGAGDSLIRLGGITRGLGAAFGLLKIPLMIAGLGAIVQAATAAGAAVAGLGAAFGAAAGAAAALPAAVGSLIQAFAGLKIASGGVGEAIKSAFAAQDEPASAMEAVMDRRRSAMRGLQQAQYGVADAAYGVREAEEGLRLSMRNQLDAQRNLTIARREAVRNLTDLKLAARGAGLSQERAALSLKQARKRLEETEMSGSADELDVSDARLAVREASLNVKQARVNANRARVDSRRALRAGVEGSDPVRGARRALSDSGKDIQRAQRGIMLAQRGQAQAAEALVDAQREVARAFRDGTSAQTAFATAMAKLSPEAQTFVRAVVALRPEFKKLQAEAGKDLFPSLTKALGNVPKALPMLGRVFRGTGRVIGKEMENLSSAMTTKGRLGDLEGIGGQQNRIISRTLRGFRSLGGALIDFMVAAEPFTDWLSKAMLGWTRWIEKSAKAGRETGSTARFLRTTREVLEVLGRTLGNVAGLFGAIGKAALPLGMDILRSFEKLTAKAEAWSKSTKGQTQLFRFFASQREPIRQLAGLIGDIAGAIFRIGTNPGAADLFKSLRGLVSPMEKIVTSFQGAFGPASVEMLTQFAELFATLTQTGVGPLTMVVTALGTVAGLINDLISAVPILGAALAAAFTVRSLSKITKALAGLTGLAGLAGGRDANGEGGRGKKGGKPGKGGGLAGAAGDIAKDSLGGLVEGVGGGADRVIVTNSRMDPVPVFIVNNPPRPGGPGGKGPGGPIVAPVPGGGGAPRPDAPDRPPRGGIFGRVGGLAGKLGKFGGPAAMLGSVAAMVGGSMLGGRAGGALQGAGMGAGIGATIGSVVPVIGTGIGGAIGGVAGGVLGAIKGDGGGGAKKQKAAGAQRAVSFLDNAGTPGAILGQERHLQGALRDRENRISGGKNQLAGTFTVDRGHRVEGNERKGVKAERDALRNSGALKGAADQLTGQLSGAFELRSKRQGAGKARTALAKDFSDQFRAAGREGRKALGGSVLQWTAELAKGDRSQRRTAAKMRRTVINEMNAMGVGVKSVNEAIGASTKTTYAQVKSNITSPLARAASEGRASFTALQNQAVGALMAQGMTRGAARATVRSFDPDNMRNGDNVRDTSSTPAGGGKARGGRLGGSGLHDTVPIGGDNIAAPGELVVNRHTEQRIFHRYGVNLGAEVAGESTPHWAPMRQGTAAAKHALGGRFDMGGTLSPRMGAARSGVRTRNAETRARAQEATQRAANQAAMMGKRGKVGFGGESYKTVQGHGGEWHDYASGRKVWVESKPLVAGAQNVVKDRGPLGIEDIRGVLSSERLKERDSARAIDAALAAGETPPSLYRQKSAAYVNQRGTTVEATQLGDFVLHALGGRARYMTTGDRSAGSRPSEPGREREGPQVNRPSNSGRIVPVPGFPGELAAASILDEIKGTVNRFPGLVLTDAYGPGRHQSVGHTKYGTNADFGGPDSVMDRATKFLVSKGYRTLYDGRFGSVAAAGHGPTSVAGSNAHLHVEFEGNGQRPRSWKHGGLSGPAGGGDGGGFSPISLKRHTVKGLGGVPKKVAQNNADIYRLGLQKAVNKAIEGMGGGVDGGPPTEGIMSARAVAKLAESVGLPGVTFAQIAKGESGFNPKAVGDDAAAGFGNTFGYGLWQITTGYNDDLIAKYGGKQGMFNARNNARAAKELYDASIKAGQPGTKPWYGTRYMTGTNLHYPEHMARSGLAHGGRVGGCGVCGGNHETLAHGGRVGGANFAGWFKQGGTIVAKRPTLIGLGDGQGTETATVTRGGTTARPTGGGSGKPGVVIESIVIENHKDGDIRDQIVREVDAAFGRVADLALDDRDGPAVLR